MIRNISRMLILALLPWSAASLGAAPQDELRERAHVLQKAAGVLSSLGRTQASEQLEREAQDLIRQAERNESRPEPGRMGLDRSIAEVEAHLQDLIARHEKLASSNPPESVRAELRERIDEAKQKLIRLRDQARGGRPARPEIEAQERKIEEAARRMEHLRVAAENLKAAGIHDIAMKLQHHADELETQIREAKERLARELEPPPGSGPRDAEIRELRLLNEQLRSELRELRQKLERR